MAVEEILKNQVVAGEDEKHPDQKQHVGLGHELRASVSPTSVDGATKEGQIFSMNGIDAVLDAKMRMLNRVLQLFMARPRDVSTLTISPDN
jgi:hypothetical protein